MGTKILPTRSGSVQLERRTKTDVQLVCQSGRHTGKGSGLWSTQKRKRDYTEHLPSSHFNDSGVNDSGPTKQLEVRRRPLDPERWINKLEKFIRMRKKK